MSDAHSVLVAAWWDDLAGSELRQRLIHHGVDAHEAWNLTMARDTSVRARARIHEVLGDA